MKWFSCVAAAVALLSGSCFADRPILLVTPQGVYQSDIVNGVPSAWRPVAFDVVVSGFGPTQPKPPVEQPPQPPTTDPVVVKVASVSKSTLKDKNEAMAVAAILDSLTKNGLSGSALKDAIGLTIPIADSSLKADGRLVEWSKQVFAVTTDAAKIKDGLVQAFGLDTAGLDQMVSAAVSGEQVESATEDITRIMEIIAMILDLLKKLGVI